MGAIKTSGPTVDSSQPQRGAPLANLPGSSAPHLQVLVSRRPVFAVSSASHYIREAKCL